jgi:copper chaperone CopZ
MEHATFTVPAMTCGHCTAAVKEELRAVDGVAEVQVDLDSKVVTVEGVDLDWSALAAAVDEAGYELIRD